MNFKNVCNLKRQRCHTHTDTHTQTTSWHPAGFNVNVGSEKLPFLLQLPDLTGRSRGGRAAGGGLASSSWLTLFAEFCLVMKSQVLAEEVEATCAGQTWAAA